MVGIYVLNCVPFEQCVPVTNTTTAVAVAFWTPKFWSQNATLVVLLVLVVISSLKMPKAFLVRSRAQRNFAYTFVVTLPTDLPSQIFHLFSN